MQILPQFARLSYSLISSIPMLAAPPAWLALPAPQIADLAAAPRIEVIRDQPPSRAEVWAQLGRVRSREEMNVEIAALCREAIDFLRQPRRSQPAAGGRP